MNQKSIVPICLTYMAGGLLGYLIVSGVLNHNAKSRTQALCTAIQPGMQKEKLISLAEARQGWFDMSTPNLAHAGSDGLNTSCHCAIGMRGNAATGVDKPICTK